MSRPLTRAQTRANVFEGARIVSTVKEDIQSLLERLPDDCTLEDVQYHIYILEKMRRGIEEARTGRVKTQEEVEAGFAEWLTE